MTSMLACVNGDLLPLDSASLQLGDLAIQRGYGVFDYLKTIDGRPVFLDDHLDRLDESMRAMRLVVSGGRATIRDQLSRLLNANAVADSGVRITVTGGYSPDGYTIATPNVILTQSPLALRPEPAGIRLITHAHRRQMPTIKTLDYLMAVFMQPIVRERGADEVLYHLDGFVSECPRNNLFLIDASGRLVTPSRFVLKGVIRKHLLRLAPPELDACERDVGFDELFTAREVFITSTTKNVVPILAIDGRPIGDGQPGPITRQLERLLREEIERQVSPP
jgi:branched-chain amino acid aminotransferase